MALVYMKNSMHAKVLIVFFFWWASFNCIEHNVLYQNMKSISQKNYAVSSIQKKGGGVVGQ